MDACSNRTLRTTLRELCDEFRTGYFLIVADPNLWEPKHTIPTAPMILKNGAARTRLLKIGSRCGLRQGKRILKRIRKAAGGGRSLDKSEFGLTQNPSSERCSYHGENLIRSLLVDGAPYAGARFGAGHEVVCAKWVFAVVA